MYVECACIPINQRHWLAPGIGVTTQAQLYIVCLLPFLCETVSVDGVLMSAVQTLLISAL